MPKGTEIKFGPWPDGINLLDEPDQLRDSQLSSCVNFDIDNTGVLSPRRAIRSVPGLSAASTYYLMGSAVLASSGSPYAFINCYTSGTDTSRFEARQDPNAASPFSVTHAGLYKSIVQYGGSLWYVPGQASSVGYSTPASVGGISTPTSVPLIPWGDYGFILKDRLFVVRKSTSEIYFSKLSDLTVWAAPLGGVVQVNPGDNQPITKVVVINNQIIIFKRDSTYIFSFTSSPTGDGVLRQISADQGAIDAITYNNEVYCYNGRSVFKFVNGYFQDIGLQLNLPGTDTIDTDAASPARINVVGKTLLFGKTPSGFIYAMNLDTGAWTSYTLPGDNTVSTGSIISRSSVGTSVFFGDGTGAVSYILVTKSITSRSDRASGGGYLNPTYSFRTKFYSFDDAESWKRLYSWHMDAQFAAASSGQATTYYNYSSNGADIVQNSNDVTDLIGSITSARFRTIGFGYSRASDAGTINSNPGPAIRAVRSVIGAKAPVSV